MAVRPKLALLHHESHRGASYHHQLALMVPHWQRAGFEVIPVYGTEQFVQADAAFVHVDLSVVPEAYLDFANRYPKVINGKIADIRKRSYSANLVGPDETYDGPVIVKTSLNSAGMPEAFSLRASRWNLWPRLRRRFFPTWDPANPLGIRDKADYRIFASLHEVPEEVLSCSGLVVEKFLPERDGDQYCLREWYFLGETEFTSCEVSSDPVFTSGTEIPEKALPPPPEIRAVRDKMGLDYGKIDFAFHEGEAVLFDVNKTTGISALDSVRSLELARILNGGIYTFFPELRPAQLAHT